MEQDLIENIISLLTILGFVVGFIWTWYLFIYSNRPILNFVTNQDGQRPRISIYVNNIGNGTAMITKQTFIVDDKEFEYSTQFQFRKYIQDRASQKLPEGVTANFNLTNHFYDSENGYLASGGNQLILEIKSEDFNYPSLLLLLNNLSINIEYKATYKFAKPIKINPLKVNLETDK